MPKLLVTDFDGTITDHDFYQLALRYTDPHDMPDYWAEYAAGRITHFEAMRGIFSHIRCTRDEMDRLVASLRPDPRLAESIERLQAGGWDVTVVSAGSSWYIDTVLREAGVTVEVHANPGEFDPAHGLNLAPPVESPFYSPSHGIDKCLVVEQGLASYDVVAFAGNGPPDLEPALLVEPHLRFARDWLAKELRSRAIPFHQFDVWSGVANQLLHL